MKKFQIIRTNAGYHAAAVGSNGEPVWTTEVHPDERDANKALEFLAEMLLDVEETDPVWTTGWVTFSIDGDEEFGQKVSLPVERVDKRGQGW